MAESRPLPQSPDLDHLRRQAKQLRSALRRGDPAAVQRLVALDLDVATATLSDCQLTLAREHGFPSWRALKTFVEASVSHGGRLRAAVQSGDLETVRAILGEHPELANACVDREHHATARTDDRGMRLLHVCVAHDRPEIARLLLAHGADPDLRHAGGRTPLHDALELGRRAMGKVLIEGGAEVDVCAAALLGDCTRLARLLDERPERIHDTSTHETVLGWAAFGGHPDVVRLLVQRGAELTAAEALIPACMCNHAAFVAAALELGADPDERAGSLGRTALHHAAELRYTQDATEVARVLLDGGADVNARDADGWTPLDVAEAGAAQLPRGVSPGPRRYDRMIDLLRERGGERGSHAPMRPADA
jgi:ankyrin repeat protein